MPIKKITEKITENGNENNNNEKESKKSKPFFIKSNSYSNLLREKAMIKYKEKEKNKNSKENLLGEEDDLNSESQNKNKKEKSIDKNKNKKGKKIVFDYLKERRKINQLKKERRKSADISPIDYISTNEIKNLIKNKGIDNNTIKLAKNKLDLIEEKAKQKNILLKCSGGVVNKPELSDEVCDLMIDSIQAKISLIKEIDKN